MFLKSVIGISCFKNLININYAKNILAHHDKCLFFVNNRMSTIIKDLLNFAHLNKNKEQFQQTNLNKILDSVKVDPELLINQKKALIQSDGLPTVEAIPVQMNQLFYNLIGNAIKFSAEERLPVIKISVIKSAKENVAKLPNFNPDINFFKISVRDNGVGFEQKYADQIFIYFNGFTKKINIAAQE